MAQKQTFQDWKRLVNIQIEKMCGLSSDDLPDCNYRDWHEDGVSATAAARRAIKRAKEG